MIKGAMNMVKTKVNGVMNNVKAMINGTIISEKVMINVDSMVNGSNEQCEEQ